MTSMAGSEQVLLAYQDLVERVEAIFIHNGCAAQVARLLAENCVSAQRDGAHSHGLFRLTGYVSSLKSGWVDGRAKPRIEEAGPAFLRIDAGNGFTVPALAAGRPMAIKQVRANGVSVIAIRNSHHLGALALDVEPFADQGLIALSVINSMKSVVPAGGRKAVFGTNPIAYAAPRRDGAPLVVDMATSSMAHGDVQLAARSGTPLPEGVGVDRDGNPTLDAVAVLEGGALLPFGGYKGAAIAMLVELLCAALVGGKFSHEVDLADHPGAATPHTGQFVLLVDPECGRGDLSHFVDRVEQLLSALQDAGQNRLPGDRRIRLREEAYRNGIPVGTETLAMLATFLTQSPASTDEL